MRITNRHSRTRGRNMFSARKKWYRAVIKDLKNNMDMPVWKKLWAYRWGFLSGKVKLFDLNGDNIGSLISDYDYIKLNPINGRFVFWIDDKLTTKYILSKYGDFVPEYYFHLTGAESRCVVKLMDCPEGYSSDTDGVIKLLQDRSSLAVKPLSGTFGNGFFKLAYRSGGYFINGAESGYEEVCALLESMNDHIVTEYVKMHESLSEIYAGSLNTLRLVIVNEDGSAPFIGIAGIKFGTSRSGAVDNISAGGIYCLADVKNGYFNGGFGIDEKNQRVFYENHPDTGRKMEGFIPNWDLVTKGIFEICRYVPQLEYMGFDIAVTAEGFKVIEINSNPGLNRTSNKWNDNLTAYFSRLLKRMGIKSVNGF